MILGDCNRFRAIHHLVVASGYESLQASLRALELSLPELSGILRQIEWDNGVRVFSVADGRLSFTTEGAQLRAKWRKAIQELGIAV